VSRPNVPVGVETAVDKSHVSAFPLVKMEFDSQTLYLSGADFEVAYDGQTWLPAYGLGQIDPIGESATAIEGLSFTISGVPSASISLALSEKYQGRKVTVKWAFVDDGVLHVDPYAWVGLLDFPAITRDGSSCTITVTAENRMIDWQRPRGLLFNHNDQQRISAGDTFFLGIEALIEREVTLFPGSFGVSSIDQAQGAAIGVLSAFQIVSSVPPPVGTPEYDEYVNNVNSVNSALAAMHMMYQA